MSTTKSIVSPSRTYVAICNKTNFDGHYMRKFYLPSKWGNDNNKASWYFLNKLDGFACIEKVITFEDYSDIEDLSLKSRCCPQCKVQMAETNYAFECLNEECDFLGYKK